MGAKKVKVKEEVPASRKLSKDDARALLKGATKLFVAKGKNRDDIALGARISADQVEKMLGPTGNLRAPCLKFGKTVVVGFNEELYGELFA